MHLNFQENQKFNAFSRRTGILPVRYVINFAEWDRAKHSDIKINAFCLQLPPECFAPTYNSAEDARAELEREQQRYQDLIERLREKGIDPEQL